MYVQLLNVPLQMILRSLNSQYRPQEKRTDFWHDRKTLFTYKSNRPKMVLNSYEIEVPY